MVVTFDKVDFKYIDKKILDQVSFTITDKDKVGIVGANGIGKTTLLKLILGEELPLKGEIIKSGGLKINYLPQEPKFPDNTPILDIIMSGSTLEHPILDYEAKSILTKLGFDDFTIFANHLSGGQLKRLALGKVLVSYCDILILDEPTNHLDSALILWLEKYLIKWKKGLCMVTHDRYFLQRVCNKMMELDFGKIYMYEANYSQFLELKTARLENLYKEQKKIKSILKKEQEWMNRGVEARRTKSKSRIEKFNKLKGIEFNEEKSMTFSSMSTRLGKNIISMKNGSKAYGNNILFDDFSFDISKNDIIGVVGENGAGKTTLFKIIMGLETLDSGQLDLGQTLNIGYFSQHLELIDPEIRVMDYIKDEGAWIDTLEGKISASELLENFLFTKELQYSKVKMLSGGEKRRLQLIRVLIKNPNILIFDEPTNDLDLYTLEILEDYLLDFKGPVLVVSHDRYFLDKICNKLFVFENKKIKESNLTFSDYIEMQTQEHTEEKTSSNNTRNKNKMPATFRNELNRLEEEIPKLEEIGKNLRFKVSQETTDYHKIMELNQKIEENDASLNKALERYFELEEMKSSFNS